MVETCSIHVPHRYIAVSFNKCTLCKSFIVIKKGCFHYVGGTMLTAAFIFPLWFLPSANHYDANTTEPISSGLQTLDELLSWQRSTASPFNVATIPLAVREPPLARSSRRTMVSHDMMGGYRDDRWDLSAIKLRGCSVNA